MAARHHERCGAKFHVYYNFRILYDILIYLCILRVDEENRAFPLSIYFPVENILLECVQGVVSLIR